MVNIEKVKKERAISILKEINLDRHYPFHDEALDMAITALESMQELEELRGYREPKKPIYRRDGSRGMDCRSCERNLFYVNSETQQFCVWCGQAVEVGNE